MKIRQIYNPVDNVKDKDTFIDICNFNNNLSCLPQLTEQYIMWYMRICHRFFNLGLLILKTNYACQLSWVDDCNPSIKETEAGCS
jgi:hypothetical protein